MKFVVISTSQRMDSMSLSVSKRIGDALSHDHNVANICDLSVLQLPFFDPGAAQQIKEANREFFDLVREADGVVLVTPEWDGMASPAAKNLMMYLTRGEVAHKCGLLVSVSSGINGAYPISELRSSSYKNTFINWVPMHLIFRMQSGTQIAAQEFLPKQFGPTLSAFQEYCRALSRARGAIQEIMLECPYGM